MASCAFCPEPLSADDPTIYHEVKSWVTGPKLDGPVLREQTGALAHKTCIDNLMHGQAPDQPVLFEVVNLKDEVTLCEAKMIDGSTCGWSLSDNGNCLNGDNHAF